MNHFIKLCVVVATGLLLVACGGGGGGGGSSPTAPTPLPTSYWEMDSYLYANGGNSAQSTAVIGDIPDFTVVAMSTATTTTTSSSLGAYTGSTLVMKLIGSTPGTYTVTTSDQLKQATRSINLIAVESMIGVGVTTGATRYNATSGTVTVTKDLHGNLHFSSATSLNMVKTQDVLGGVVGAPVFMTLNIVDAF